MALLDVILGYDCNLACDYCTITPEMRSRSLSREQVLRSLVQGRELGYDAVSFTGGEPTIRPDLLGLIAAARRLGYADIKVQSNGLLLAQPANVDRLIAAGVQRFHISIHTHERDAYEALVRRAQTHSLMVAALDHLVARQVTLVADVIVKSDTVARLSDAIAWLHARGVRSVHLWYVSLTDGNRDHVESLPPMSEAVPAMRRAFAFGRDHAMSVLSLHVPRCLLGDDVAHAYDPGADRVMVVTPEATFELKDSRLAGRVYVPACEGCAHRGICPGVRPDYLEQFGDAEIAGARQQTASIPARRRLPLRG